MDETGKPRRTDTRFPSHYGLVGRSPQLTHVIDRVERLAASDIPVLILGETGTGKELVARALHEAGPRGAGPFIPVNCAAFPEKDILYTELFGAARGAFTGCTREIVGALEAADGGTLFLDEVSELSAKAQASLLRFLDGGEVKRLGEARVRRSDVRLVCATQTPLLALVRQGLMRSDLYYRIGRSNLALPPLRERGGDVPLLIDYFLGELCRRAEKRVSLDDSLKVALEEYSWPGNVRELQSEISALVALAPEEVDLGFDALSHDIRESLTNRRNSRGEGSGYRERVNQAEVRALRELMEECGWVVARAARRIGMSRNGLSNKLRRLGIVRPIERGG
jgi:transcriptional regulator with GAF, ATPase, and Fis domain